MHLEKKEAEERARRKGLTGKTIIQFIWLAISFGLAYLLINALQTEGRFSYAEIYRGLSIPTSVDVRIVQGVLMLFVVIFMQFLLFIIFAFANPEGRRRTGTPSLHSRNKDPFDDRF